MNSPPRHRGMSATSPTRPARQKALFVGFLLCMQACSGSGNTDKSGPGAGADVVVAQDGGSVADTAVMEDATTSIGTDTGSVDAQADAGANFAAKAPATLGGKRPAKLVTPKAYDGKQLFPLVVLLGGYDYFAADLDDWIKLSQRVDEAGFVLLLPDGLVDSEGSPYWNATDTCCDFDGTGVNDVGYLSGLLDEALEKVAIDAKRVVLVGHSAGGFMAYRWACDESERIAAVVSIAGSSWLDATKCGAKSAVSVLQVHGDEDEVMPIDGDSGAPGAETVLKRWATRGGCDWASWGKTGAKLEHADDGVAAETEVWAVQKTCKKPVDIRFWKMAGQDHYPAFRPAFTTAILAWAVAQARP